MINGFNIFGLKIYFYALIIIAGALLGAYLASREAKRRGFSPDMVWDVLPWLLMAGIIGARLWHVFTPPASMLIDGKNPYFIYPLDILKFRNGGLGIPGGVMAGVLALWLYAKKKKIAFSTWLDILGPGLALAQAIGRWGNYFNQEVYGLPSKLPWAIFIDPAHRLPGFESIERYHPTFFYEFLWSLMNMAILLWVARKFSDKLKSGDIFLLYMIIYPVGRFLLEFIRIEYSPIAGININQTVMALIAIGSLVALIMRHTKRKPLAEKIKEQ
jgi:phosphatidylglycerol:prolipoprotein diacylglycerol transferase